MTAITVSYSTIANSAVDADSPVTEALVTALRDNAQYVYEWLGAGFTAGAEQDHNHDGVNSSLIEVGPNAIRNGSFESGENNWTFTDYTGGSHAPESSNDMHGANSMSITSTVLANGGGYAVSDEFIACAESVEVAYEVFIKASAANVSARVEFIWYDDAQSQISASAVVDLTNTPTSATAYAGYATSAATARYYKIRITGGVPAAGSATGTVYFDGIRIARAVARDWLKVTTAAGSTGITGGSAFTYSLAGANWSMWTASSTLPGGSSGAAFGNGNQAAGIIGGLVTGSGGGTFYIDERYFQSSPPYDLGDGEVRKFVYARVAPDGSITGAFVGDDPIWQNHSRINIKRPFFVETTADGVPLDQVLADPALRADLLTGKSRIRRTERAVTDQVKRAVMARWAAPFDSVMARLDPQTSSIIQEQQAIVLLDPVSDFVGRLGEIAAAEGPRTVVDLIEAGHIQIGNQQKAGRADLPGVMQVDCSFRNSAP